MYGGEMERRDVAPREKGRKFGMGFWLFLGRIRQVVPLLEIPSCIWRLKSKGNAGRRAFPASRVVGCISPFPISPRASKRASNSSPVHLKSLKTMSIFVFGHRNPDTDAICSAIAYADYLQKTSRPDAIAACCGTRTSGPNSHSRRRGFRCRRSSWMFGRKSSMFVIASRFQLMKARFSTKSTSG